MKTLTIGSRNSHVELEHARISMKMRSPHNEAERLALLEMIVIKLSVLILKELGKKLDLSIRITELCLWLSN